MSAFHVFKIVQMVPNRAMHRISSLNFSYIYIYIYQRRIQHPVEHLRLGFLAKIVNGDV